MPAAFLRSVPRRIAPALTLLLLSPLITEFLSGSTQVSHAGALPLEMGMWGGSAVLIREAVRRLRLGWFNMLLLGLALALAVECLLDQLALSPNLFALAKAAVYGRAGGVNYVFLLWALGYESVFAVLVPVALSELIFVERRDEPWLNLPGAILLILYWLAAAALTWFVFTHIVVVKVLHLPLYVPPMAAIAIAAAAIAALILLALGPARRRLAGRARTRTWSWPLPAIWVPALTAFVIAALWQLVIYLGMGSRPDVPPLAVMAGGIALAAIALFCFPRWYAAKGWGDAHGYAVAASALVAMMLVTCTNVLWASPLDFYGKIVLDAVAALLLAGLGVAVARRSRPGGAG